MATKSNISYLRNLYSKHRNIILYGLIGGSGALLDLLVYVFLYELSKEVKVDTASVMMKAMPVYDLC